MQEQSAAVHSDESNGRASNMTDRLLDTFTKRAGSGTGSSDLPKRRGRESRVLRLAPWCARRSVMLGARRKTATSWPSPTPG